MGLGTRFDPGVIGTPLSVVGGLLDELVGALAKDVMDQPPRGGFASCGDRPKTSASGFDTTT